MDLLLVESGSTKLCEPKDLVGLSRGTKVRTGPNMSHKRWVGGLSECMFSLCGEEKVERSP